ncbi:DUF982 domain-containing protein [Rhizobium ruizarguesonis]|uniref:DUF982 domain-containing protein n=1 Tax=Rhizobium ruizarguesonis TaxID=2081791 RepID=UPI0013EEB702
MSHRWPKRANDTAWQHALATCTRSLQLETDTSKARAAFVEAARQTGLKVLPDDAWKPIRRRHRSTVTHRSRRGSHTRVSATAEVRWTTKTERRSFRFHS